MLSIPHRSLGSRCSFLPPVNSVLFLINRSGNYPWVDVHMRSNLFNGLRQVVYMCGQGEGGEAASAENERDEEEESRLTDSVVNFSRFFLVSLLRRLRPCFMRLFSRFACMHALLALRFLIAERNSRKLARFVNGGWFLGLGFRLILFYASLMAWILNLCKRSGFGKHCNFYFII